MKTVYYKELIGKKITVIRHRCGNKHEDTGILKDFNQTHLCLEQENECGRKFNLWVFKISGKHDCILTDMELIN